MFFSPKLFSLCYGVRLCVVVVVVVVVAVCARLYNDKTVASHRKM